MDLSSSIVLRSAYFAENQEQRTVRDVELVIVHGSVNWKITNYTTQTNVYVWFFKLTVQENILTAI